MKAYVVTAGDDDACIVHAESRGKALALGRRRLLWTDYVALRARRAPEYDAGVPSIAGLMRDHNWHYACRVCSHLVSAGDLDEGARLLDGDDAHPTCATCVARGGT